MDSMPEIYQPVLEWNWVIGIYFVAFFLLRYFACCQLGRRLVYFLIMIGFFCVSCCICFCFFKVKG